MEKEKNIISFPRVKYINMSYYYSGTYKFITIFEGEYLNGERKEGKEYNYEGKLIYEGEYLNGKRNGKGKIYDDNGHLKYEGEFIDGKKNGKGKEYKIYNSDYNSDKNEIFFEGEYMNDYRIRGKEFFEDGKLKYEGE